MIKTKKSYFVYIALCSDDTLYTGYTDDIKSRENTHNGLNKSQGAKYTRSRRPIKIVHTEKFDNKSDAMKREIEIKKLSRKQKLSLILNS